MQDMNDQSIPTEPSAPSEQPAAQSNVQNTQPTPTMFKPKKRNQNKRRKKTSSHGSEDIMITDESISEAFQLLHQCAQIQQPESDSYTAFGHYENMII
ncbi:unnamed protein product [Parnassius apollo]|uniref:(apollo) hypothetical protein n=1 Tax=Parnassius apollo TaxID=110799 RepID=A0A8S3WB88_PARAO|nr:unnamed protein product [Parnassius apollo]